MYAPDYRCSFTLAALLALLPMTLGVVTAQPVLRPGTNIPPVTQRGGLPHSLRAELRELPGGDVPLIIHGSPGWEARLLAVLRGDQPPADWVRPEHCFIPRVAEPVHEHDYHADYDYDDDGYKGLLCHAEGETSIDASDCDDYDPRRSPRDSSVRGFYDAHGVYTLFSAERSDEEWKDEDCNYTTVGSTDADGDGYTSSEDRQVIRSIYTRRPIGIMVGGDCNDYVAEMNPRAPEVPDDGVDNNCNGATDEPPSSEALRYYRQPPARLSDL